MIEGRGSMERLGREVFKMLQEHTMREDGIEPQMSVSQTKNCIVIDAETFHAESFIVTVATARRKVDGP